MICWKKSDYIRLGQAVSQFNRTIKKLETEENKLFLPNPYIYSELKEQISSRRDLERIIRNLKRIKYKNAVDLIRLESGERLIRWEYNLLNSNIRIVRNRLLREYRELELPDEQGFSRLQMGSIRAREIEAQLNRLAKYRTKRGREFKELQENIRYFASDLYRDNRNYAYYENYGKVMKKYSHFDNYDKWEAFYNKLSPLRFYEIMSQDELLKDLTYQSDQNYIQEAFNQFLIGLGIDIDVDSISL